MGTADNTLLKQLVQSVVVHGGEILVEIFLLQIYALSCRIGQ